MALLRSMFGPSKEEIWRKVSRQIGADYVEGSWTQASRVEAQHGEWTITLDCYTITANNTSTSYTRIRAPYVNKDGFQFLIYRRGVFSSIGKLFGMQDIEVGFPEFDDAFIIKGNDEAKLRGLFKNPTIRKLLHNQTDVRLQVKDDEGWFGAKFPDGVDELCFTACGVVRDIDRLTALFGLFAETLDELCRIGSAYEGHPGMDLH